MNAPGQRLRSVPAALAAALLALPVLGAGLLVGFLTHGVHDGGLSLIAALGGLAITECVGHLLAARVSFDSGALLRTSRALVAVLLSELEPDDEGPAGAEEYPAPVVPALSSYFALYAGLGGWANTGHPRGSRAVALSPAGR